MISPSSSYSGRRRHSAATTGNFCFSNSSTSLRPSTKPLDSVTSICTLKLHGPDRRPRRAATLPGLAPRSISGFLGPGVDDCPTQFKIRIEMGSLLDCAIQFRRPSEPLQIVRIDHIRQFSVWKTFSDGTLRDARLQPALDGVPGKIVRSAESVRGKKRLGVRQAFSSQALRFSTVHQVN